MCCTPLKLCSEHFPPTKETNQRQAKPSLPALRLAQKLVILLLVGWSLTVCQANSLSTNKKLSEI